MNLHEYMSMVNNSKQKYGMVYASEEFYKITQTTFNVVSFV
jgi:hypothetical protein